MLYLFLSILAGFTLAISLPNYFIPFGFLIGYSILFYIVEKFSYKKVFLYSFIAGFTFSIFSFYWIIYAIVNYGHINIYISAILFFIFSLFYSLIVFTFYFLVLKFLYKRYKYKSLLLAPFLMVLFEIMREYFPFTGFPWNLNGYMLSYINQIGQIVSIFSIYGLSFLILYFSVSFYFMIIKRDFKFIFLNIFNIFFFVVLFTYGDFRIKNYEDKGKPYKVAILQGNVDESLKVNPSFEINKEILDKYLNLFEEVKKYNPDIAVLPESALPFFPYINNSLKAYFFEKFNYIKIPFLAGFDNVILNENLEIKNVYNSLFLVDQDGNYTDYYTKIKLVPFGEYTPIKIDFLKDTFQYLQGLDFSSGNLKKILEFKKEEKLPMKIVPCICFESIFPIFISDFINEGGNVIVNVTNDGWFGKTAAPYQHFEMARVRAIENNVYLVRAANTGISAIINPVGVIKEKINLYQYGFIVGDVYISNGKTIFNQHKVEIFVVYIFTFLSILILLEFYKRKGEIK